MYSRVTDIDTQLVQKKWDLLGTDYIQYPLPKGNPKGRLGQTGTRLGQSHWILIGFGPLRTSKTHIGSMYAKKKTLFTYEIYNLL